MFHGRRQEWPPVVHLGGMSPSLNTPALHQHIMEWRKNYILRVYNRKMLLWLILDYLDYTPHHSFTWNLILYHRFQIYQSSVNLRYVHRYLSEAKKGRRLSTNWGLPVQMPDQSLSKFKSTALAGQNNRHFLPQSRHWSSTNTLFMNGIRECSL